MATVAYKGAGAGVSTEASGGALSPPYPATVDANDIAIWQVLWEGTASSPSTPAGLTLLGGPFPIQGSTARMWVFGKLCVGNEDGATVAFGAPAVTTQRGARCYTFSGYESGTLAEIVRVVEATTHATDPQMPTVETRVAGARAVALVAQHDNNALGSATGESGGDWTEAVAEYVAALNPGLVLQLQTCLPTADPGTVSGGAVAATDDPSGVIGLEIRPKPAGADASFPNTSVLDDFNRADGALGVNWTPFAGLPAAGVKSNQAGNTAESGNGSGAYTAAKFGPDQEVFASIPTLAAGGYVGLWLRAVDPPAKWDGYYVEAGSDGTTIVYRTSGESRTAIGPAIATPWASGDKLGAAVTGSVIRVYRYSGGAWRLIGQRTDATYSGGGYVGFWRSESATRIDDFGGGGEEVAPPPPPLEWELVFDSGMDDGETAVCALGVLDGELYLFGSTNEDAGAMAGVHRWNGSDWDQLSDLDGEDFNLMSTWGTTVYKGKLYVGDRRRGRLRRLDLDSAGEFVALTDVGGEAFVGSEDVFPGPALWGRLYLGTYGNAFNPDLGLEPPGVYRFDGAAVTQILDLEDIGVGGEVSSFAVFEGKLWVSAVNADRDLCEIWTIEEDDTATLVLTGSTVYRLATFEDQLIAATWEESIESSPAESRLVVWDGSGFDPLAGPWSVIRGSDWIARVGMQVWGSDYYHGITAWDGASTANIGFGAWVTDPDESSPTSEAYGGATCIRRAGGYVWVVTDQPVKVWRVPVPETLLVRGDDTWRSAARKVHDGSEWVEA